MEYAHSTAVRHHEPLQENCNMTWEKNKTGVKPWVEKTTQEIFSATCSRQTNGAPMSPACECMFAQRYLQYVQSNMSVFVGTLLKELLPRAWVITSALS